MAFSYDCQRLDCSSLLTSATDAPDLSGQQWVSGIKRGSRAADDFAGGDLKPVTARSLALQPDVSSTLSL